MKDKVVKKPEIRRGSFPAGYGERLQEELGRNQIRLGRKQTQKISDRGKILQKWVSMMTGIPVKRMVRAETDKLRRMAEEMRGMVVGQDEAIQKVVKAIQRNRVGLKDRKSRLVLYFPRTYRGG